jgi:hypothetical protein
MPIPFDSDTREWLDISLANPHLVDQFRPALLALMAFGKSGEPQFVGSAFNIASGDGYVLALTAKHVVVDGVRRIQEPHPRHALSSWFVPVSQTVPSLSPQNLKAVWAGTHGASMMNVWHLGYNETLDLACILVGSQSEHAIPFTPTVVPMDLRVPSIGSVVQLVSLDGLAARELEPPADRSGQGQMIQIHRRTCVRLGTVTGVYPLGLRHYGWPCFTTSIPVEPGMSGGLVSIVLDGETVSACGVVCADNSEDGARTNYTMSGDSIIACVWPSLALETAVTMAADTDTSSLFEMMLKGAMPPAVGGLNGLEVAKQGNSDYRITRK